MKRDKFLKTGIKALGTMMVVPVFSACKNGFSAELMNSDCALTPSETAGPFPTKDPASFQIVDITSDRTGVALEMQISIKNQNKNCEAIKGAIVDVWQCDKDGYYSEYGGVRLQQRDLRELHFLRGRQISDEFGLVKFSSIFPGWYPGRAPHIHVHIFDSNGKSLLVTQIAFPQEICDHVYKEADDLYTKGKQDTLNSRDNVFGRDLQQELAIVSGDIATGYTLTHSIIVDA